MKKLVSLLLSAALMLSLAACGGSTAGSTAASSQAASSEAASSQAASSESTEPLSTTDAVRIADRRPEGPHHHGPGEPAAHGGGRLRLSGL